MKYAVILRDEQREKDTEGQRKSVRERVCSTSLFENEKEVFEGNE